MKLTQEQELEKSIRMRLGKLWSDRIAAGMKETEATRLWEEETQEAFSVLAKEREHRRLAARREHIIRGATKTDSPCGAHSCWEASGDVCACSCSGFNHGIAHDSERKEEYQRLAQRSI